MKLLKLSLAVLVGFILGASFFHASTAKANIGVHVTSVTMTSGNVPASLPDGSKVVGFS